MSKTLISRALVWLLILLVVGAIATRYYAYFVSKDYQLYAQIPCDAGVATCFVNDCDPSDEECDTTPFLFAEMSAAHAPDCFEENSCETFACSADDESCEIIGCSEETLYEGVLCAEPEIDIEENLEPEREEVLNEGAEENMETSGEISEL